MIERIEAREGLTVKIGKRSAWRCLLQRNWLLVLKEFEEIAAINLHLFIYLPTNLHPLLFNIDIFLLVLIFSTDFGSLAKLFLSVFPVVFEVNPIQRTPQQSSNFLKNEFSLISAKIFEVVGSNALDLKDYLLFMFTQGDDRFSSLIVKTKREDESLQHDYLAEKRSPSCRASRL